MTLRYEIIPAVSPGVPAEGLDLVMELRGSEASRFTLRDTPLFPCLARGLDEAADSLG